MAKSISPSLEDYIEVIYNTIKEKSVARAKDIKDELSVHGASVTGALRTLADKGLINYKPYEYITLTSEGEKIGKAISRRHKILRDFMINVLGKDPESTEQVACGMEHSMDPDLTVRLATFLEFTEKNPQILEHFQNYFRDHYGEDGEGCCPVEILPGLKEVAVKSEDAEGKLLSDAIEDQIVKIKSVSGGEELRKRLNEMGFLPGENVTVNRNSGKGPLIVAVKGSNYVLHRGMAKKVVIE